MGGFGVPPSPPQKKSHGRKWMEKRRVENKTSLERGRMEDLFWRFLEQHTYPGGGFIFFKFSPLLGEMIQFD